MTAGNARPELGRAFLQLSAGTERRAASWQPYGLECACTHNTATREHKMIKRLTQYRVTFDGGECTTKDTHAAAMSYIAAGVSVGQPAELYAIDHRSVTIGDWARTTYSARDAIALAEQEGDEARAELIDGDANDDGEAEHFAAHVPGVAALGDQLAAAIAPLDGIELSCAPSFCDACGATGDEPCRPGCVGEAHAIESGTAAVCTQHGTQRVIETTEFPGFAGGSSIQLLLSCGCSTLDESADVAAAR